MRDTKALRDLFHRRWAMPAMGMLWASKGEKFVTLFRRLGASQGSMRVTLDELIDRGWVMKNPGYGHPMRPEYVLTKKGLVIGQRCQALATLLRSLSLEKVAAMKWAMPTAFVLRSGPLRFGEVASELPGATDRAVAIGLKALVQSGMVERTVEDTYPPSVTYDLTSVGARLVGPLRALAGVVRRGQVSKT